MSQCLLGVFAGIGHDLLFTPMMKMNNKPPFSSQPTKFPAKMPGRTSVRASVRAARNSDATVSRKSSTTTLKSRASSTRSSAYAVQIPDEGEATSLREAICSVFSDAQRGAATQRKSVVTLRKVQEACCYESAKPRKNALEQDYDESEFNEEVGRCALRLLGIRKAEPVGDRLIKFLVLFLKHSSEKGGTKATRHITTALLTS